MRVRLAFVLACVFALIAGLPARAATALSGLVIDASSGVAIPSTRVQIVETKTSTITDAAGRFVVDVPAAGSYHIALSHSGYQPALSAGLAVSASDSTPTLVMHRATDNLRTIAVTSTSRSQSLVQPSTYTVTLDTELP